MHLFSVLYSVLHICPCKGTFFHNSAFHDKIHNTFSLTSVHQRFIKGCWRSSFPNCPQSLKLLLSFFCLIEERYSGYRQFLYPWSKRNHLITFRRRESLRGNKNRTIVSGCDKNGGRTLKRIYIFTCTRRSKGSLSTFHVDKNFN